MFSVDSLTAKVNKRQLLKKAACNASISFTKKYI